MDVKKYWLGVDGYDYDLMSPEKDPTIHLTIGDMNLTLRDIPGVDSEIQLMDLEEHDQELKDRFIKAWQRIQRLDHDTRRELFEDLYVLDIMEKYSIDFIEGVLDDYESIKVGDEIFDHYFKCRGIIIGIDDDTYWYLQQGSGDRIGHVKKRVTIQKTGKHFDFIERYCKKEGNE